MIQRIQSAYLFISIGLVAVYFFLGDWMTGLEGGEWLFTLLSVFLGATIIMAIIAMISYSDRSRQISFLSYLQWITLAWFAFEIFVVYRLEVLRKLLDGVLSPGYYAILMIPALVYVLARMAKKAVQADVDLIKSADRIR